MFHVHLIKHRFTEGTHAYYTCRCGARKTAILYDNLAGPHKPGWPKPDWHRGSSGWVKPLTPPAKTGRIEETSR